MIAAAAILTLFVLPAEYGVDPTGVGTALGLTGMVAGKAEAAPAAQAPQPRPLSPRRPRRASPKPRPGGRTR